MDRRARRRARGAGAGFLRALAVLLALAVGVLATASVALASEPTNSGDDLRDGWYPEQSSLTPQLVSGGTFGQLWSANVEGSVYAQPLLADGVVLVATEDNKVYALDPTTGAMHWSAPLNLGTPWNAADIGCGDLAPHIGVTATPVVDPTTNTAYMTHKTYVSGSSGPARWFMDAVELSTGKEKAGFPVALEGSAQNASGQTFQATDSAATAGSAADGRRRLCRVRLRLRPHAVAGMGLRRLDRRPGQGPLGRRFHRQRRRASGSRARG